MTNHRGKYIMYSDACRETLRHVHIMYSYALYTARLILISGQHTRKRVRGYLDA